MEGGNGLNGQENKKTVGNGERKTDTSCLPSYGETRFKQKCKILNMKANC